MLPRVRYSLLGRPLGLLVGIRPLSSAETKAALKPFYFAVHPDLFGQFPTQRAVNEDSLKRLNSYIDNLQNKFPVDPTHLTFFLKNEAQKQEQEKKRREDGFKTVRISLFSRDLGFTVRQILKSCGMFEDFVAVYGTQNSFHAPFGGPLDWLQVYRQFSDKRGLHKFEEKPEINLKDFLKSHSNEAKEKLVISQKIREEIFLLSESICSDFGLSKLDMDCGWSCSSCQGSLRNFYQLCKEKKEDIRSLKGRSVVFTNWTGVDPMGRVMLNIQDVPQFWLVLLGSLEDYDVLVHQVPLWEQRLSKAMGDVKIAYGNDSISITVTEYLNHLHRVVMSLRRISYGKTGYALYPGTFKDVRARILSPTGSLTLSPCGDFRIPASIPGEMLVDFLHKNKNKANKLQQDHKSDASKEENVVKACMDQLKLNSLSRDASVSPLQMVNCCEKLLELPADELLGTRLIVSKYYQVSEDGGISIPWDWK